MGIRDFLDRLRRKKEKYSEFEEDMKVQERYYEKKKSANERELERYQNEQREREIKAELDKWREMKKNEVEFGHQILNTKNMFEKEQPVIMKQKNLFTSKSNLNTKGGLFWK